ncbi:NAD(P)/FAD-dependent oxidoreductase [Siculibacillus lacustris]|uniref:NAD(P)/FAD-dependent oxidoreductase n=1 Tax=Siculibacillus lacustris TaxID=1549641 RepID=A0A4Q9VQH0_9HYPH|nr:NAD(P)/FAD-dependent oxidoreductase [Siculibacillus lacustris]TBW38066.1 NAD(P)/FAD-dependent oxidoreductase [Siculibacillus lacustris]
MRVDADVLVIGAGPAGLTSSYLLSKAGRSVIVLERDPTRVGGISRTVDYKGFLFDIGGHRFFSKSKEVVALWRELLPDDFLERPRTSRIFYRNKLYSYPLKAFEALWNLGLLQSAACVASYAWARVKPVAEPKTFHQWVRNQFGERLFGIFFKTYTEKVWGMSCDDISADWAAQRIKGLNLGAAVWNALTRSFRRSAAVAKDGEVIKTLIESFDYPRKGPGMMWEAAAAKTRAQGGRILMGRSLGAMRFDAATGIWTVTATTADGETETFTARHVISSAPIRELADAVQPAPLSLFSARALKYRDFITVALITTKKDLFADNWIYIHDPSVKVGRVQNFRSWSPEMVPDPNLACLGLEYFCFEGDDMWTKSDADLIALASDEIERIGLVPKDTVVDACVVRQPKAYPVYDDDYKHHVKMVRLDLERAYPTLHLVGRNGMHKYNNQDHAMMTAMLTVENILAGERLWDTWNVNEDAEYHEAGGSGVAAALGSERLVPRRIA